MRLKHLVIALPAALFALGSSAATAGQVVDEAGVVTWSTDKWN